MNIEDELIKTWAMNKGITPAEMKVLSFIAEGMVNKEIADELGISDGTAKLHVKSVLRKLNVNNRTRAAVIYLKTLGYCVPVSDGSILVMTGRVLHERMMGEFSMILSRSGYKNVTIIALQDDQRLDAIDVDGMARHGWVRADSSGS